MPLYWGDYLRDTYDLTAEEHGAYLLLIGALWLNDGSLPLDRAPSLSRVRPQRWPKVWPRIAGFFQVDGTIIKQRRVTSQLAHAHERSDGAAKAAKSRWSDHADALPTHSERNANQNQNHTQNQKINPPNPPLGGVEFGQFWKEYPRKVGKGAAERAWRRGKPPLAAVLAALSWQRVSDQWRKDGGDFIPNPATWINQRRWEDERPRGVGAPSMSPEEKRRRDREADEAIRKEKESRV